jgi:hypothetical protein
VDSSQTTRIVGNLEEK